MDARWQGLAGRTSPALPRDACAPAWIPGAETFARYANIAREPAARQAWQWNGSAVATAAVGARRWLGLAPEPAENLRDVPAVCDAIPRQACREPRLQTEKGHGAALRDKSGQPASLLFLS